ncbi:hypothetical protein T11_1904 [Trichinella zimbabwensis]|uniref:Uncharacterized protein n=1 Tax=Trichinella zimbabwensis TaxID=268475 RepID=A0A0V1HCU2_9BILA|nr:hypothetical protein T11_1904 [Trichinella zimbabwensis]
MCLFKLSSAVVTCHNQWTHWKRMDSCTLYVIRFAAPFLTPRECFLSILINFAIQRHRTFPVHRTSTTIESEAT